MYLVEKARREIIKGKKRSELSFIIPFSHKTTHMCVNIYVPKF